jgi:hypothetical protein
MTRDVFFDEKFSVLTDVCNYIESTKDDKYGGAVIDTIKYMQKTDFNIGNACKYLARYNTEGYAKSKNPADLMKAIHYCIAELASQRLNQLDNNK